MVGLHARRRGSPVLANVTTAGGAINTVTTGVELGFIPNAVMFIIDVTAAATDVGDTLNITIKTLIGAKWHPIYQSSEYLGNGGTHIEISDRNLAARAPTYGTTSGRALAGNSTRGGVGAAEGGAECAAAGWRPPRGSSRHRRPYPRGPGPPSWARR